MKKFINNFSKAIKTELIKKKRSGIFILSLIIGLLIPIVVFVFNLIEYKEVLDQGIPVNYYFELISKNINGFSSFFFPMLIIICASKIAQIDHKNKGWHLMETLPATKFSIYFSKFSILLVSNSIAIITFMLFSVFFGWVFSLIHEPGIDKIMSVPFMDIIKLSVKLFIIGLCITAFQYILSVLIRGFIWPILIGFFLLMLVMILQDVKLNFNWYPYILLHQIAKHPKGSDFGYWFTYADGLSVLYSSILLYVGFKWYQFKTFALAFIHSGKKTLQLIFVLLILGSLIGYTIIPKQQQRQSQTVVTGTFISDLEVNELYLLSNPIGDTIAKTKIVDDTFKFHLDDNLDSDYYKLQLGKYVGVDIYFGAKDSIQVDCKMFNRKIDVKVSGTRIAENKPQSKLLVWNTYAHWLRQNQKLEDADYYMEEIYETWQKNKAKIKATRTIDNLKPSEDFLNRIRKQVNILFLNDWNEFKKKRATFHPKTPYVLTEGIKELENSISMNEKSMLSDPIYFSYVEKQLIKDDKRDINEDIKFFDAILNLESGHFKDNLLFQRLNKSLWEATEVNKRDSLVSKYLSAIQSNSYKNLLLKKLTKYNSLSKGVAAPNFKGYNIDNKHFTLENFKGKYLVIDVWASWCGPCKKEAPFYEKKALSYKNKPIQFISISTDRSEKDWIVAIKDKSKSVLQLRANNIELFSKDFDIQGIPRFILIDPDGKFVFSNFVRPSAKTFDELLKKYLE